MTGVMLFIAIPSIAVPTPRRENSLWRATPKTKEFRRLATFAAHRAATARAAFVQMIMRGAGRATGLLMTNPNKLTDRRLAKTAVAGPGCRGWRAALSSFAMLVAVLALSGCGLSSDGAGALFVDPGRFTLYHCDDLAARRKVLMARENELRGLIERAGESPGGAVVGSFAYRSDYDSVLAEEKLLQRNAAEKNCSFASPLQSDQTIR
jgi:hypothetical protein